VNTRLKTNQLQGDIQMVVDSKNQTSSCDILDLSPSGGMKIQCDMELNKFDTITISSPQFKATKATCAWRKGNVYGLQFAA
jgi:hypothetical protein